MSILIKEVRVNGFRGLENFSIELDEITVLTGMNNSGKTSFLKAMQLALGQRNFISQDDFYIKNNKIVSRIVIDILIIPVDHQNKRLSDFTEEYEILFTTDRIKTNGVDSFIPLRTIVTYEPIKNNFKITQFVLNEWPEFNNGSQNWFEVNNGNKTVFIFDEIPYFYIDAQRDILDDTKLKNSYLGKMLSRIEYSEEQIRLIEDNIKDLNETAVSNSDILKNLKNVLKELDTAIGNKREGIDITPFTKKIRDLNKGLTIYYGDENDSFSMEYHGMGTRSWSSLLTLKSFILLLSKNAELESKIYFPIIAIEEPESHLHPNAQKRLYAQINEIKGQKIISTHSPYVANSAELTQIRNFYKLKGVECGKLDNDLLNDELKRKIRRQVTNTRGEMYFSKVIILFEGETEEQALPILFENYFGINNGAFGVDFIGVGGINNYLPFIIFSESFGIPWLILSDADNNALNIIYDQFKKSNSNKNYADVIVFLDNGNDFEKQLISDGFQDEIKKSILSLDEYTNEQHRQAKEPTRIIEVNNYNDNELYDYLISNKTKMSPIVATHIIKSSKSLSPKIVDLFEKIKNIIK